MSVPVEASAGEAFDVLSRLRVEFYESLHARADALFELTDAVLHADGPVKTLVESSLAVEHRRGHGAMHQALDRGWAEPARLRRALAGLPLRNAADGRIVLAVDVSNRLRPDAPTSDNRLLCHVCGRGARSRDQFVPGWPYSFVAASEAGRTSWVALLDAVRPGPADDATALAASQLRGVVERLTGAGQWKPGDPKILIVTDSGYDVAYLSHALADLPVVLPGRLRSDRVLLRDPGPAPSGPRGGRPRRHGDVLALARSKTWHTPQVTTSTDTTHHGRAATMAWDRMRPRLTHRGPWLEHAKEELPVLHGTLIRLKVERLAAGAGPGTRRQAAAPRAGLGRRPAGGQGPGGPHDAGARYLHREDQTGTGLDAAVPELAHGFHRRVELTRHVRLSPTSPSGARGPLAPSPACPAESAKPAWEKPIPPARACLVALVTRLAVDWPPSARVWRGARVGREEAVRAAGRELSGVRGGPAARNGRRGLKDQSQ